MLFACANASLNEGLTAAQKLAGFSGAYGLGGGLGGLTLNDIAYDLSASFTQACQQVGIKLGISLLSTASGDYIPVSPVGINSFVPNVQFLDQDKIILDTPVVSPIQSDPEILLKSESFGYESDGIVLKEEPNSKLMSENLGYNLLPLSMGDRLTSKLTSDLPFVTSKYRIGTGGKHIVSGYSSHIIHAAKHGPTKSYGGESRVTFTQVHTEPSKQVTAPLSYEESIDSQQLIDGLFTPFSYEYPSEYESALTKRRSYVSETNGGFGSLITGSYGSVINNGYKSAQLLSEGGLKGLKFSFYKK